MSKKTTYLLGILLTILIGTIFYWFLCCKPCLEAKNAAIKAEKMEVETPKVKEVSKNAFSIIDSKSGLKFNANDNFNFKGSGFSILEPVSENLNTQIQKLTTYIKGNPGKIVNVTGHYTSTENNSSAFPNLGLARANAVKNYLVTQGVSSKNINTLGQLKEGLIADKSNVYFGPLSYSINTLEANDTSQADELKALKQSILADPLVLYFDTASASINLTAAQRQKVAKMSNYLDKADNALIKTIGHTDNIGSRNTNVSLGLSRAEFAKNYLVQNGIASSKINSSSKGPDQPITDNNTAAGRAKNRRVVVTLN